MQVPDRNEPIGEQLRKASAMCLDILSQYFEDLAVEVLRVIPAMVQSDSPWQHRYFFFFTSPSTWITESLTARTQRTHHRTWQGERRVSYGDCR